MDIVVVMEGGWLDVVVVLGGWLLIVVLFDARVCRFR